MSTKLSQRLIETLQPQRSRYFVRDSEVKGLAIGVNPTGRKSFYVYYRVGGGRSAMERRPVIGTFPAMTVQAARVRAKEYLAGAASGEDPSAERTAARKAKQLHEFAVLYFEDKLTVSVEVTKHNGFRYWLVPSIKPSNYHRNLISNWNRYIGPKLARRRLQDISPSQCHNLHAEISRKHPIHANRVIELLRHMINRAILLGHLPPMENPCSSVKPNVQPRRRRYASPEELARLGKALERSQGTNLIVERAIRFLLYTGLRKMEALSLRWNQVDIDLGIARLNTKTGQLDKKLSALALGVLKTLPRDSQYVFPSQTKPDCHLVDIRKVWRSILRDAGIDDLTIHDMRRTYATYGTHLHGLWTASRMLGHASQTTTERSYAQHDMERVAEAEDGTAAHIERLITGPIAQVIHAKPK